MRRALPIVLVPLLAGACCAQAESPLLRESRQALAESLPPVALYKLRTLLATPELPPEESAEATLLLAQALAGSGQPEEALSTAQPLVAAGEARAVLLRAEILAAAGRWAEARPLYHSVAAQPDAPPGAAAGEAECLQALGRPEEAAILLEGLIHSSRATNAVRVRYAVLLAELRRLPEAQQALNALSPATPVEAKWKRYAEARLLLAQDQAAPAWHELEALLEERESLPENLFVAATFAACDARLALHGTQEADDVLEAFIWKHPASAYLPSVYRRLDQIYAAEESPSESELRRWAQAPEKRRAALARFYLGKMQMRTGRLEKAMASFDFFAKGHPAHPLAGEAWLLQAEIATAQGNHARAVQHLESAMRVTEDPASRAVIELRTGLAHFQQGEYLLSATLFESAARHSPRIRPVATFNAALAWLHVHNFEHFRAQYRTFLQQQPESPLRGELILEEGLEQARTHDPAAAETLKAFVRDFPRSPRVAEARLALAEVALASGEPADPVLLQVDNPVPAAPEIAAQTAYLAIFLADAQQPPDEAKVIALAQKFLAERPSAPQVAEVRMKLGQVYFRRGDYASAETHFAALAGAPAGPYTEAALFLAGESAMKLINPGSVDRAFTFFDRVVKLDGSLKLYARQEQAIMQSRLEHEDQAIELYGIILSSPSVDAELWQASLCGKGDCLLALGRRALPATERLSEAISVFDQLAQAPGVSAVWRNQALYKKAKALEQLGREDEALATFYDVLNAPAQNEHEYFWFYKAGFDAAHTYEQQEKWKSAIGIYQKMAKLEGPRTAEAQGRLRQVRLEHFIWD